MMCSPPPHLRRSPRMAPDASLACRMYTPSMSSTPQLPDRAGARWLLLESSPVPPKLLVVLLRALAARLLPEPGRRRVSVTLWVCPENTGSNRCGSMHVLWTQDSGQQQLGMLASARMSNAQMCVLISGQRSMRYKGVSSTQHAPALWVRCAAVSQGTHAGTGTTLRLALNLGSPSHLTSEDCSSASRKRGFLRQVGCRSQPPLESARHEPCHASTARHTKKCVACMPRTDREQRGCKSRKERSAHLLTDPTQSVT